MANTTDPVRGRVTFPEFVKGATNALFEAARLRPVHQVRPLSFFLEGSETQARRTYPAWRVAYRHLEKAAERARRAADRSPAFGTSAWIARASADLTLSRRAIAAFSMIEIRVHAGVRTFAAGRGLLADTCNWLDAAAEPDSADVVVLKQRLLAVADRLDEHAYELRKVLRIG